MTLNYSYSITIQDMYFANPSKSYCLNAPLELTATTSLKKTTKKIEDRIDGLISKLIRSFEKAYPKRYGQMTFEINKGTKYYKIMEVTHSIGLISGRSVHAFVCKQTGVIYKPAGYRAPAKHVRYNLLDNASYAECLKQADWAGSYLYIR